MRCVIALLCICLPFAAQAKPADAAALTDAQLQRATTLYDSLRCVVCEGQSLASSQAKMAIEMRQLIQKKILQGQSNAEITAFFVQRYGESVLMQPPVKQHTLLLWGAPLFFIAIGMVVVVLNRRCG